MHVANCLMLVRDGSPQLQWNSNKTELHDSEMGDDTPCACALCWPAPAGDAGIRQGGCPVGMMGRRIHAQKVRANGNGQDIAKLSNDIAQRITKVTGSISQGIAR